MVNLVAQGCVGQDTETSSSSYNMHITIRALTAQVLVKCGDGAAMKQQPGCYTMIEIPVIDMLPGDREELIAHLV